MFEDQANEWGAWLRDVAGYGIKATVDNRYTQKYDLQRLQLEALGDYGYYTEGQPGVYRRAGTSMGIPSGLLILGAVVVGFLLLKD